MTDYSILRTLACLPTCSIPLPLLPPPPHPQYYRRSNIELQRLDAVSRSPIYAHFSETLSGVETIRAYRMAEYFALTRWEGGSPGAGAGELRRQLVGHLCPRERAPNCLLLPSSCSMPHPFPTSLHPPSPATPSDAKVDANHRAYFTARMANEWLSMRLDAIGAW